MRVSAACFLLFVVCCSVAGSLLILLTQLRHDKVRTAAATAVPAARHITKSLAELRNEGPVPELSDHVLFFNHVPKAGGEMLVLLLQWLQGLNGFRHVRLRGGAHRRLSRADQEELVEEVVSTIKKEAVPITFDRHVYFINFTQFDRQSPMYINLVRDPVIKASSRFYYMRVTPNPRNPDIKAAPVHHTIHSSSRTFSECVLSGDPECTFVTGKPYDLSIPYFCGQEEWCMLLNNERALEKAKANVDRYFPVVGVLEELNATLYVLERRLPYFFRGIQKIYFEELSEPHMNRNNKHLHNIPKEVRSRLEETLKTEYEFYTWIRARLLLQLK
ncbi:heparan sulfate 2-O-sulfotransferase pipe [Anabrus simplex]|uniref:heparan sulfate 2-O-sulfotransferase pipe n=1 Tax=Anabrus simplex TaxID=316456 RepID=UPI0035A38596